MDAKKKEAIMECTSFDEVLDAEYGERGTGLGVVLLFVAFGFYLIKKSKKYRR